MNPSDTHGGASVPRGVRPDAETSERIYLIKNASILRATCQIRLLALRAAATGKEFVLLVPPECRWDASLDGLIESAPCLVRREDL